MLKKAFIQKRKSGILKNEGEVEKARLKFLNKPSKNLKFIIENRYDWMNEYIEESDTGLEIGCGSGASKFYIKCNNYLITDNADYDWLDVKHVDAFNTPFNENHFDFVVVSNMIHHLSHPKLFFKEMKRVLKAEGILIIQEVNASFLMRLSVRLLGHEGYSYETDVFDENVVCTDPEDPWAGNNAIPNLLFDDIGKFENNFPYFKVIKSSHSEFFNFFNSGGVVVKSFYIPLPFSALRVLKTLDDFLASNFPDVFALQRQVVLRNVK